MTCSVYYGLLLKDLVKIRRRPCSFKKHALESVLFCHEMRLFWTLIKNILRKSNRLDDTSTTRTSAGRDKFWPMTLPKCPWWRPLQNISARRERRFRGTITEKNAHTKALSFQMENSEYPFQSSFKKPSNLTIWTVVQDVFEKPASVKQL